MKKLLFCVSLITLCLSQSSTLSATRGVAFFNTLVGIGTVGAAYTLYNDANENIVKQGIKHAFNKTTSNSLIAKIRLDVQSIIGKMIKPENITTRLEVERAMYVALGIIGAFIAIVGVEDYITTCIQDIINYYVKEQARISGL